MSTTNPYKPPQEASEKRLPDLVPGTYVGGYWAVTAVGVIAGLLTAGILVSEIWVDVIPTPFIAPAVTWIGSFVVLMLMLRGAQIEPPVWVFLPILLSIPAYILYVPVCTFSAMFTTAFMGSDGYGPTFPGMILASVVSFVGILLLFAAILRRRFKQPAEIADKDIVISIPTEFDAPGEEVTDE